MGRWGSAPMWGVGGGGLQTTFTYKIAKEKKMLLLKTTCQLGQELTTEYVICPTKVQFPFAEPQNEGFVKPPFAFANAHFVYPISWTLTLSGTKSITQLILLPDCEVEHKIWKHSPAIINVEKKVFSVTRVQPLLSELSPSLCCHVIEGSYLFFGMHDCRSVLIPCLCLSVYLKIKLKTQFDLSNFISSDK